MAAPKGNSFWKVRAKHGRDKLFTTPQLLWEACSEYFEWSDNNPWVKCEAIKSGEQTGEIIRVPTARPYTLKGLCIFLDVSERYWGNFRDNVKDDEDFMRVITHVEQIIYTQKFEGAAIGAFNQNIIARDLGLKENVEHGGIPDAKIPDIIIYNTAPPMADSEDRIDDKKE